MDPLISQTQIKMQKAFDILHQDFTTVHVGKASPVLVENVLVRAYGEGQKFKLLELATIHAQDTKTIVITPFDQSIIADIQKGIQEANLNLNPIVDQSIIRINLPPLTEERRKELVKLVNQKAENGKVMVRQVRHEAMDEIKKKGEEGHISEDEVERLEKETQKLTDEYMGKVDSLLEQKENELLTV